jgi:beta-lactamase class A
MTVESALERLLATDSPAADWFAPSFLRAVPPAKMQEIVARLHAEGGSLRTIRAEGSHWVAELERASCRIEAALDGQGRFVSLWFKPLDVQTATLEEALADLRALPGKASVLVTSDGADRGAIEPDLPLAVGSTFKLATLAALRREIDGKKRSWRDVVELAPEARSLPSGILQEWPAGAALTVDSLATLMIAQSDNTATDTLIHLLGRNAIEPFASRNRPYPTTRELFVLKAPANAELLGRWRRGDEAGRRALLDAIRSLPLPDRAAYPREPTALDVEWFFSARELCDLMKAVHDLPFMSINPGPAERADWDAVAFKGGSEPGVINMTTWLEKNGHAHCVSATWNAPERLDEPRFAVAYRRILTWLKGPAIR